MENRFSLISFRYRIPFSFSRRLIFVTGTRHKAAVCSACKMIIKHEAVEGRRRARRRAECQELFVRAFRVLKGKMFSVASSSEIFDPGDVKSLIDNMPSMRDNLLNLKCSEITKCFRLMTTSITSRDLERSQRCLHVEKCYAKALDEHSFARILTSRSHL